MRHTLTIIVVLAVIALLVLVTVKVPPSASSIVVGSLPLQTGFLTLPNDGTYVAPCGAGSLPIRWAIFVYQSNRSNATFHLAGAWTASRPTSVDFGFSANITSMEDLRTWILFAHCPLRSGGPSPPATAPTPPALPLSGSVDYRITTLPSATLFVLMFRSFSSSDVIEVNQSFTVTPA